MNAIDRTDWVAFSLRTLHDLATNATGEEVTMATNVMEQTARTISETYSSSHRQLVGQSPQERQRAWEDSVGALTNFDLNEPTDQIQAKAYLDTLDQVLFAATRATGSNGDTF